MKTSRRQWIRSTSLGAGAVSLTGCQRIISQLTASFGQSVPEALEPPSSSAIDPDFHLLSRAAFGPWPGDLARLKAMGRAAWIEEQLHPEGISDSLCDLRARRFESLSFSPGDAYEFKKDVLRDELTRHTLLRAVYSKRQLFEVMVEFWTDHLNIDLEKGDCIYLKPSDDREVIRRHALGKFRDLIRASATSPAMLIYLDGASNKVRRHHEDVPNENYARELLELHTLGVDGGYTQQDVVEVARAFTGWSVLPPGFDERRGRARSDAAMRLGFVTHDNGFLFRADAHDAESKVVLGTKLAAGRGLEDGRDVLGLLARHPSTAHHIATKFARRFVADEPSPELVDTLAQAFTASGGDTRALIRCLVAQPEFWRQRGAKIKSPFELAASTIRATGVSVTRARGVLDWIERMGQPLYAAPAPTGFGDTAEAWVSAGALLSRMHFAVAFASGGIVGVTAPALDMPADLDRSDLLAHTLDQLLGGRATADLAEGLAADAADPGFAARITAADTSSFPADGEDDAAAPERRPPTASSLPPSVQIAAVVLGSPEFQRR
ncbi:MAG: DUF1800 domain-containing protein [Verrucomicrobiales bacterium]|nr:DUF1800 domain-containing protein [Verrucomicrobiales bacterium]